MPKATYSIVPILMLSGLGELPCLRHPDTDFILQNEATTLRNRQEFQRTQLTELASTDFGSWAKESFEIATKIAYRNGGRIGIPKGGNKDCTMIAAAAVLPAGYVVSARRIADRRMILVGYRLADLLIRVTLNLD
jgi:hypothetical protein